MVLNHMNTPTAKLSPTATLPANAARKGRENCPENARKRESAGSETPQDPSILEVSFNGSNNRKVPMFRPVGCPMRHAEPASS